MHHTHSSREHHPTLPALLALALIAIRPNTDNFGDRVSASVSSTVTLIGTSVKSSMHNQSSQYADTINAWVATAQSQLSGRLIGWIDNTINAFYTDP
ncbi:hypothetical protein FOMPIDRAFT_1055318 [Fomitopsis schrenkii]|uniref:Uncharacterized protein n=1 Tax=Fomitopsis schrenkii TaxID=2126942 RepID=S8DSM2_FOMSC|nr:hypothetical protein FOMPIDRAFT_1055318 [Fomitopsis schrenkii]